MWFINHLRSEELCSTLRTRYVHKLFEILLQGSLVYLYPFYLCIQYLHIQIHGYLFYNLVYFIVKLAKIWPLEALLMVFTYFWHTSLLFSYVLFC